MTLKDLIRTLDDLRRLDMLDRAYYTNRNRKAQDHAAYEHRKDERAALMAKWYAAVGARETRRFPNTKTG